MTIHFFVGNEFSLNTDFDALNQAALILNTQSLRYQKIRFYSARTTDVNSVAHLFEPNDTIIGASAGGVPAERLAKAVDEVGRAINPLIIGFEPYCMKDRKGVVTLVQADDPRRMIKKNMKNHCIYQLQDGTAEEFGREKQYIYGHAFYTVKPAFVGLLDYDPLTLIPVGDTDYVILPEARLTYRNTIYVYKNLIAKRDTPNSPFLDATSGSRVFQYDFINNLVNALQSKTNLEWENLGDGYALKKIPVAEPEDDIVVEREPIPVFPSSYRSIWVTTQGDYRDKAIAFLNDYTKSNSALRRFFSGHWNRHHVSRVVEMLSQQDLTLDNLLLDLEAIQNTPGFNPEGSLAKRIEFIQYQIKQEQPNEPRQQRNLN